MLKKIFNLFVVLVMMIGIFSVTACDEMIWKQKTMKITDFDGLKDLPSTKAISKVLLMR
jgi:hypothetical protein